MINSFVLLAAIVLCVAQERESIPKEFGSSKEFPPLKKFSKSRIWRVSKNSTAIHTDPVRNVDFSTNFVDESGEKVHDRQTTWEDLTKSLGRDKIKVFLSNLPLHLLKNVTRVARKNPKLGEKKLIELFFQQNDRGTSNMKRAKTNNSLFNFKARDKDHSESHEKASSEHQDGKHKNSEHQNINFHQYSTTSFSTAEPQPPSSAFEVPKYEDRLPHPASGHFRDSQDDNNRLTLIKYGSSSETEKEHGQSGDSTLKALNSLTNSGYFLPELTTSEPQTIEYVDSEFPSENNNALQGSLHTFHPKLDEFLNPPLPDSDSEVHDSQSENELSNFYHEKPIDHYSASSVWKPPYPYSHNMGESQHHVFYTNSNQTQSFPEPQLEADFLPIKVHNIVDQRRGPDTVKSTEMESTESRYVHYRNDPYIPSNYSYGHSTVHFEPPSKSHSVQVIDSLYNNDRGSSLSQPEQQYSPQPQSWVSQPQENFDHLRNNNNNNNNNDYSPSPYNNENDIASYNKPKTIYNNIPEKLNDSPSAVWSTDDVSHSHHPISDTSPAHSPAYSPVPIIVESYGGDHHDQSGWSWGTGKFDSFWGQFKSYFTKGEKSTAEKVFEISIGILSFLAFGGYMLMLIYQVFAVSSSFPLFPLFNKTVPQNPTLFGLLVGRSSTDGSYRVNPNAVFDKKYVDELESIVKSAMERVKASWFSMSGSKNGTLENDLEQS